MDGFNDLLRDANTTAPFLQDFLGRIPGLAWLQSFVSQWLKLDITTIAAALTILGTISGVLGFLQTIAVKLYWYITRFFTASVSINARDKLNREVLNWLGAQVLVRQGTRIVTARSEKIESDAFYYRRTPEPRDDYSMDKRKPIQYLPTFGTTWFTHERNVFIVRRVSGNSSGMSFVDQVPDEFAAAPEGDEPLIVMCLGRSVEPIKRFLDACRDFAEKERESYVTVRASKSQYGDESWETTILRPIRPLETIHFDEKTKAELVADIRNYLDPATRRFYTQRGIPYRRGYLLHGPAGTGKTSLSLGLAGLFGLELYLLHVPSVRTDTDLERLFTTLPPRCFILLEDIDAVGIKNRGNFDQDEREENDEDDEDDDDRSHFGPRCHISLSGLLNVLDGVASQEGRIVLMTSNFAEKLDRALVRPGRIDKMIFLGNISPRSAELMFKRMYEFDPSNPSAQAIQAIGEDELQKLALSFSRKIEENTFTPAQIQGYLLNWRSDPQGAVDNLIEWSKEEIALMEEAKRRAKEAAVARKKRKQKQLNLVLGPNMMGGVPNMALNGLQSQVHGLPTPPQSAISAKPQSGESVGSVDVVSYEETKEAKEKTAETQTT
ncbi:mitochondrial chaperone bcs1 [Diaporthe amygdali]|uniref:mitochondrial chaperone bcs1 n=1 Tax=Phomopsis amygdali TaxID=1214568 RepID=UPI0022FDF47E|nr:mitochondrial chaperone bcs1 [Diaporthe amygdali]KAJ0125307.1 mitochondrial chaperone bcs1 [Diaporthe amygdali]